MSGRIAVCAAGFGGGMECSMKLIRHIFKEKEYYGEVVNDEVHQLTGSLEGGLVKTGISYKLDDVRLLSPVKPSKIICVGLNYLDHIIESNEVIPEAPVVFMKPPTAVIAAGEGIQYPKQSKRVDYEGELAVIIGKRTCKVSEEDAENYILGYTCANDVTARDLQTPNGQWIIAKGFDTFLPLGPCITTDINPNDLEIRTLLNDRIVQASNTRQLLFKPQMLVSFISSIMTLMPGDVILTGTTSGIGPMKAGDKVVVEIEQIGRLENHIEKIG